MKLLENLGAPAVLMFIGALISAAGAIWASQRQVISETELRHKSDEIAELNKQIAAAITGGDSFAYMVLTYLKNAENPRPVLLHQGEYPLYDLNVRIVDLALLELGRQTHQEYSISDMRRDEVRLVIGNLAPHESRLFDPVKLDGDVLRWNLFFNGRNGFFTESLRFRRVGNEWKTAVLVTKSDPTTGETTTLLEKVDPDYPRGKDGKVVW